MNFTEALAALMERKLVARDSWEAEGKYLCAMPGMPHVWQILTQPNPNAGNFLPSIDDLLATDWKVK